MFVVSTLGCFLSDQQQGRRAVWIATLVPLGKPHQRLQRHWQVKARIRHLEILWEECMYSLWSSKKYALRQMADFTLLLNRFWFRAQQFLLYLALAELVGTSGKVIANLAALHRCPTCFNFSPNFYKISLFLSKFGTWNSDCLQFVSSAKMSINYFWFQELDCLRLSYGGNFISSMYLATCT